MAGAVVDQSDRKAEFQLAAAGLGQDAAAQAGAQEMEFSFLCRPVDYAVLSLGWSRLRSSREFGVPAEPT